MLENQYGQLSTEKAAQLRAECQIEKDPVKYIYSLNYFPDMATTLNIDQVNSTGVQTLINYIKTNGVRPGRYQGRYPNIIWLDFVTRGNGLTIVQNINTQFRTTKNTALFQPIK